MTPAERDALVARIVACRAAFSGTTLVPYSDRHRITKPPMSGAPEAPLALLAVLRDCLERLEL